ncbi:hypothetical protein CPT_Sonora_078 [Stenotrophomonas phage Sonora]|nr:hypothetical protein CPT_Sonora_078 [Stenotrophomonas phage Sonora]
MSPTQSVGDDYIERGIKALMKDRIYSTSDWELVSAMVEAARERGVSFDLRFRSGNYYLELC